MTLARNALRSFSISFRNSYKIAIIGAGPAGFYTAHRLLRKPSNFSLSIDFFDKLPTPFGLSRYGVAPDHPEVKNCEECLQDIMTDFPDRVRFFGNVSVGESIPLKEISSRYNSIILAYGCTASDNKLDIPGADSPGVISARQFVNWYNGYSGSIVQAPPIDEVENITIIGNGNVAIDIARVLLADPKSHWAPTDITTNAVELLSRSKVKNVNIVARRGLLESAFTNKEIRELLSLSEKCDISFRPIAENILNSVRHDSKSLGRVAKRKFAILDKASKSTRVSKCGKSWGLYFYLSPLEFQANKGNPRLMSSTLFQKTNVSIDSLTNETSITGSPNHVEMKNELVILSIGYKGDALKGFEEEDLRFDAKKNCVANNQGRVLRLGTDSLTSETNVLYKKGWYASGWIKNGPKGVIATTMMEAFDTADKVFEDLSNEIYNQPNNSNDITDVLPDTYVTWEGWNKINRHEVEQGRMLDKPRKKVQSRTEMLSIAQKN